MKWIDIYVEGLIEHCYSRDIFEIYNELDIHIIKVNKDNLTLQGNESVYIRDCHGIEVVFIRNDLDYNFKKFILSHELGHAMLHVELSKAAYDKSLINKGKLEKQADYFALKLLNISIDPVELEGLDIDQVSKALHIPKNSLALEVK